MSKFSLLLTLIFSLSAFAEKQPPPEVQKLTQNFNTTMMECPQKIWSDYSWEGLKVALTYPSKNQLWLWDASTSSIRQVSSSELPVSAMGSSYSFFEINGHKAMSLNMEEKDFDIFQLGVHELFHYVGQVDWMRNQTGGRGTSYPLSGQPRFYRRMIFDHLREHLLNGSKESLGRAKYWFKKWSDEFLLETQATTDGYEGTAEYAETMGTAVAELGCSATDEQIKAKVIEEVLTEFGHSVDGQNFALDGEGYEIGGLAALILRFHTPSLFEWNSQVASGETPLQVLFDSITPIKESAPEELRNTFMQAAQRVNEEQGPILDDDIANWNDKSYVRVPTPFKWLQSNLMPKFFAHSSELDMDLFPLATDHHYISPNDDGSDFRLREDAVVFSHYTTACPGEYYFTLVPQQLITQNQREAVLSSDSVIGRLAGGIKTDENGLKYYCLE